MHIESLIYRCLKTLLLLGKLGFKAINYLFYRGKGGGGCIMSHIYYFFSDKTITILSKNLGFKMHEFHSLFSRIFVESSLESSREISRHLERYFA